MYCNCVHLCSIGNSIADRRHHDYPQATTKERLHLIHSLSDAHNTWEVVYKIFLFLLKQKFIYKQQIILLSFAVAVKLSE